MRHGTENARFEIASATREGISASLRRFTGGQSTRATLDMAQKKVTDLRWYGIPGVMLRAFQWPPCVDGEEVVSYTAACSNTGMFAIGTDGSTF
jgi:hypothetical protein